ncbi:MAG: signal peptide peptidase SppA [Pontiellaceae bacterium]|nr:signal peptide peptidase SppA [Pontiellaceae bacterium]MBN2784671.1 signal peptide peptidase SppA [Pontiellaceae bacterium]
MSNAPKTGYWVLLILLIMLLAGSVATNFGLIAYLFGGNASYAGPVDEMPDYEEIWSYGSYDDLALENKVVRISLSGVIMRGRQERLLGSDPDMVETILTQILAARSDPYVRAILLEVDSPGGAVTPSDEIYAALKMFKESDEDRVIVVFIRGLGASGAYYASMAGDYIVAEPTAIVGSVGVIMQSLNMKELGDKIGLKSVTIASGDNKDMLNPLKDVDPEHMAMMQDLVDEMQDRFASIVMNARNFENPELLDGRVFTAPRALDHGFIDEVGYWLDAVEALKDLMGMDELCIVRYAQPVGLLDELLGAQAPKLPSLQSVESPRLLYQWKP